MAGILPRYTKMDAVTCFRLSAPEYESVASEVVGTWVDKEQFRELYERGVAGDHSFLWVLFKKGRFYRNYTTRLVPS